MKATEDLHQLIRSLSPAEKSYFRSYAGLQSRNPQKNYLRLFDAIDRQEEYDEDALRKRFRKETFAKQFAVTKRYLYKLLLESLDVYHAKFSGSQKLKRLMHQVEVLHHKGLYRQAWKLLQKARQLAGKGEMYLAGIELSEWEKRLAGRMLPLDKEESELDRLHTEGNKMITALQHTRQTDRLHTNLLIRANRHGEMTGPADLEKYQPLYDELSQQPEPAAHMKRARYYFYSAWAVFYRQSIDLPAAYTYDKKALEALENMADDTKTFPLSYGNQLYNFLNSAVSLRRFDRYFNTRMERLRSLPTDHEKHPDKRQHLESVIFLNYYITQLRRYTFTGDFEKGKALLPAIEAGLQAHATHLDTNTSIVLGLYMNLGILYFSAGEYGEALSWLNIIANDPQANRRQELFSWVKILSLICHYELGNDELLEHQTRSAWRYIRKHGHTYRAEKTILLFFKNELPKTQDGKSRKAALKKLQGDLHRLTTSRYEQLILEEPDILSWLQSRIEGLSLPQVIKAKTKK